LKRLEEEKRLVKVEKIEHNVGTCWRCGTPLEIVNKEQWFIKTVELKDRILQIANELKWYPEFMKKRLEDWVNGLEWDWVVSRQRYFATPIPAWICPDGHVVYALKEDLLKRNSHVDPTVENPPVDKCPICGKPLKGVEEVFDTWVDSSISPLFNTYFYRDNNLFKKLYPMSLRPQAHDIIRTWAFYSIIRCDIATGNKPWNDIFIDGHILAEDGRPMHASWGNVVDPLKIIEEFGTDPFRYFAATCTLGEDTPFRKRELVHGKKLLNKLWNVANFVEMNIKSKSEIYPEDSMDLWILSEFSETLENVTLFMDQYRYDRAIRELDEFFWHVFADHYIELIKYRVSKNLGTQYTLYNVFLGIIKMYAPFMPHITEEIYHRLFSKYEGKISIHLETWPEKYEKIFLDEGRIVKEIIASLRKYKNENNLRGINEVIIISPKLDITSAYDSIKGSLGISKLEIIKNASLKEIIVEAKPDLSKIGPLLKNSVSNFMEIFKNIPPERLLEGFEFKGIKIPKDYFEFKKIYTFEGKKVNVININDVTIIIK
jgi:valyl-tRNA synthetase